MTEKEEVIDRLDFTEAEYDAKRTPEMLPFDETIDNAIVQFDALAEDGFKHGSKVEEVAYILNDMWSKLN